MEGQRLRKNMAERDRSNACRSLRRNDLSLPDALFDFQYLRPHVQVLPLKREKLSKPEACKRDAEEQTSESNRHLVQNPANLLPGPCRLIGSATDGLVPIANGRALDQIVVLGQMEDPIQ